MWRFLLTPIRAPVLICIVMAALSSTQKNQVPDVQFDWTGRWTMHNPDPAVIERRPYPALIVVGNRPRGFWAGCYWLPAGAATVDRERLIVQIAVPGIAYSIMLERTDSDHATATFIYPPAQQGKPTRRDSYVATRMPLVDGCGASDSGSLPAP